MIGKYINNNSKEIIIIFQSAGRIPIGDLKKILTNEVTEETIRNHHKRHTWVKFANNNPQFDYIFVEDYYSKCYGWYMIDSGKIIIDDINKNLDEFFMDKSYDKVIAYGSSKGGTAALLYGIINKYITHVFSLVPQIEVSTYFNRYYRAYKKLFFGTTELEKNENVRKNEYILNNFLYDKSNDVLNKQTQFIIYTGPNDKQFKQLMTFYNKIKDADNLKIVINMSNDVHDSLVFENLDFIYNILANIIDPNIIENTTIKVNDQIYLYYNLNNEKENQ